MALGPSFTDNPIVSAIGNALGMGGLMDATKAGSAPAGQLKPPPVSVDETARLRDSRAIRQSYPKASAPRGSGPGAAPAGPGMNMPGVMSPDVLLHPEVQKLLGVYGISPEDLHQTVANANPNLFVNDPNAFDKHPVLSNLLERGLEGLAFTKGSNTVGEGLSNVAQGLANAQAARSDKYNNMLMMPFAQAKQVADLHNAALEEQAKISQMQYERAHADYYDQLPELRQAMIDAQLKTHKDALDVKKSMAVQKLSTDPAMSHLTKDENASFAQELQDNDYELPDDRWNYWHGVGQQHLDDFNAKTKKDVAAIGAGARIKTAEINNNGKSPIEKATLTEAQNNEKGIADEQKQFLATLDKGIPATDSDGNFVAPGDTAAISKARAKYKSRWDEAHQKVQDILQGMKLPGSSIDVPKKPKASGHIPTYDVKTGKIT